MDSQNEVQSMMLSLRPGAYAPILKKTVLDPTQACEICQKHMRAKRVLVDVVSVLCELDACESCARVAEIKHSSTQG